MEETERRTRLRKALKIYGITVRDKNESLEDLEQKVIEALEGGVKCIQLREKGLPESELIEWTRKLVEDCHRYDALLILNDNPQAAIAAEADGVHLGQSDGNPKDVRRMAEEAGLDANNWIIGVTAPSIELARKAQEDGADYVGAGALFPTTTKLDARALPMETFSRIASSIEIPIVGIGGVNATNLHRMKGTGAAGAAIAGGLFLSGPVKTKAEELCRMAEIFD